MRNLNRKSTPKSCSSHRCVALVEESDVGILVCGVNFLPTWVSAWETSSRDLGSRRRFNVLFMMFSSEVRRVWLWCQSWDSNLRILNNLWLQLEFLMSKFLFGILGSLLGFPHGRALPCFKLSWKL